MLRIISKSLQLLLFTVVICCVIYPAVLWAIGQVFFPFQANGSLVGADGKPAASDATAVGSLLIAQPFTKDEFFQPRPSACSFDASASASSALASSNYALRNRVATTIGPIATYKSGANAGKPVGPDIESWFQQDKFGGNASIVRNGLTRITALPKAGSARLTMPRIRRHSSSMCSTGEKPIPTWSPNSKPTTPIIRDPAPADLAVIFFETFSKENPGKFCGRDENWRSGQIDHHRRAGQGGQRYSIDLLRHVAAGACRCRPAAGARRSGDNFRFRSRSEYHT